MTKNAYRLLTGTACLCLALGATQRAEARLTRVFQMPGGTVLGCTACHVSPAGGGPRTPFGQDVNAIIGGSPASVPFWSAVLAAKDSDGDGFCNGQELGDPDGDGTATPGAVVTNPGVSTSKPANSPPVITSSPPLQATVGRPYQYQAVAEDIDACQQLTYSKVAGPTWLTVSTNGLVSGTPSDGAGGDVEVTLAVADNGSPAQSAQQTYAFSVVSSFAGWQELNFDLPSEADLAGPLDDPDRDGIVNLLEYAYRLDPRVPGGLEPPRPTVDADRRMQVVTALRDDDPKLTVHLVVADSLLLTPSSFVAGTVTDPTPDDGFKTWTFVDTAEPRDGPARFGRLTIELRP